MHDMLRWDNETELRLQEVQNTLPDNARQLLCQWQQQHVSFSRMYLLLALAEARWVDHHGPLIGHGTFNGGPIMKASTLLYPPYQNLALLHMAHYVLGLIRHPNYGPYLMGEHLKTQESLEEIQHQFIPDLETGEMPLLSENRAAELATLAGIHARWLMIRAALRQYPENEHRLLIVQRALEFLDDTNGWHYAEAFFRAAIQYLGHRPDVHFTKQVLAAWPGTRAPLWQGTIDAKEVEKLRQDLVRCEFGQEPQKIITAISQNINGSTLLEAISLTASTLMFLSGFDAHAVTGIHCVIDLLRDQRCPIDIRHLAWPLVLSSSRTRRQKAKRTDWIVDDPVTHVMQQGITSSSRVISRDDIIKSLYTDRTGLEAASYTRQYLQTGGDPTQLTRVFIETALTTEEPFDALHNVKMLWGLLNETLHCRSPAHWIHLSAGARVIAQSITASPTTTSILQQWDKLNACIKE
ncbi:hypothetical protein [Sulfobacillus thermosulfidooxidans]|uniref:hypothetical protein n=1 Tax=Sulfobacillus thermosulfidooxidans TaxID=28034 RepID=UPI00031C0152|nr:hypothetical protein [Sulfobacillus thermosulfidooxidans]